MRNPLFSKRARLSAGKTLELNDLHANMALHKSVVAAYADGYASHAAGWMRGHGWELGGIEAYAAERGLAPSRLKETVTLMSRYAAAKKAGKIPARSFSLPLESAAHASHHLIQAGLDDFDVHTDEGSELTYFSFKTNEDFSTAHEIVHHAFHRQIQSGEGEWANWKQLEPAPRKMGSKLGIEDDDLGMQDIDDPVCLCGHTFSHHGRYCDICDDSKCSGYDPKPMEQQVEYVCEHRAFGRVGKKSNPMVFERGKNDRILKVYFDGGRVSRAEFQENKGSRPEIRQGWEGFYSFTQAFGD